MSETTTTTSDMKSTGYEIFIGLLSLLSIVNLVLMYVIDDEDLSKVLLAMNALLSLIFMSDFLYRLLTAPSKRGYVLHQYGWADFLASLPFEQVKILRIFRLLRVSRMLRQNGGKGIGRSLVDDRAGSALYLLLLMGILVLQFGSLWMLRIEQGAPGANIVTASDALWYVIVTISTVGYGDQYPVTNAGRLLGSMIIVIGVGIFGTFTGYLANLFLAPRTKKTPVEVSTPDAARRKIAELQELLDRQQAATAEIQELLDSLPG